MKTTIAIFQKNLLYEKLEKTIIRIFQKTILIKKLSHLIYNKKFHI